jgi:dTDP-4-amino-4,6-dideoxygalactose transaminase
MTSHRETAYKNTHGNVSLPFSEKMCDNSIILPLYVPMKDEDVSLVINNVIRFLA